MAFMSIDFSQLPAPNDRNIAIHLTQPAERAIREGHPWVFDDGIASQSKDGQAGDLAIIFDNRKDKFLAIGLYDPQSPIRIKLLQHYTSATIGRDFFQQRLQAASDKRSAIRENGTTGYRLVHGENDRLPSLVIDRYADTLVIKLYSSAWFAHLQDVLSTLDTVQPSARWLLRLSRTVQAGETYGLFDGQWLKGDSAPQPTQFTENGLTFAADILHGHKTGFFFDQRDNRLRVRQLAQDKRVLDVFAYNGGFSVNAAAGGAASVLSLDISQPALEDARYNMQLNADNANVAACDHEILAADAFEGLQTLAANGKQFDLVVVDPPSFAKRQNEVDGALAAYMRLTQLALDVVVPQGIVVMASCSSRVSAEAFYNAVFGAAHRAGHHLHEIQRTQHAPDHPIIDTFPEGAYLKCLYATVS